MSRHAPDITVEMLLRAYRFGVFPMAETRSSDRLHWLDPKQRGVLPLDEFHLSRRLLRTALSGAFEVSADTDFASVIAGCAMPAFGRPDTWINPRIEALFTEMHRQGHAHSIECRQSGALVGGLYGVAIGGAFFGESMFSFVTDASKVALAHLVARLRLGGFRLLDTQFVTDHLLQFGARDIPRADYKARLAAAVDAPAQWLTSPNPDAVRAELRAMAGRYGSI